MTLRKLKWMADGRREQEYDIAFATAAYAGAAVWGKLKADAKNPYRDQGPERAKSPEEKKADTREGMDTLRAGLREMARGRG